ncbi:MAG: PTS IIA-like nitrogen-regulatory protein PtsN [Gammaproteobacteria bacterium]|nr:MAG: PTS IIA-like nitrogen-regulatory protein PtsN [Gammaproteobacteria bacterium]
MHVKNILDPSRTFWGVRGKSKKRTLEHIAHYISKEVPSLDPIELFDNLLSREKLGSTGIGYGIAIPHCRISHCGQTLGSLIYLQNPVDFDAIDGNLVDLIFVLIVPKEATQKHLDLLGELATLFNDEPFRQRLRASKNPEQLYQAFIDDFIENAQDNASASG